MTPEETERMYVLCAEIAKEKEPQKFTKLVTELNGLLEKKRSRIDPDHRASQPGETKAQKIKT